MIPRVVFPVRWSALSTMSTLRPGRKSLRCCPFMRLSFCLASALRTSKGVSRDIGLRLGNEGSKPGEESYEALRLKSAVTIQWSEASADLSCLKTASDFWVAAISGDIKIWSILLYPHFLAVFGLVG